MESKSARITDMAARMGSTGTTVEGLRRYAATHRFAQGGGVGRGVPCITRYTHVIPSWAAALGLSRPAGAGRVAAYPLHDAAMAAVAYAAVDVCGRSRVSTEPLVGAGSAGVTERKIDVSGDMPGGYRYRAYEYVGFYVSYVAVARSGAVAWAVRGEDVRRLPAPSGLRWAGSEDGACLIALDKTKYHPESSDLRARDFVARVRAGLTRARTRRRAAAREAAATRASMQAALTSHVCLDDARGLGHCLAGVRDWVGAHVSREWAARLADVGGQMPAELLAPHMGDERVQQIVLRAYARETMVSI